MFIIVFIGLVKWANTNNSFLKQGCFLWPVLASLGAKGLKKVNLCFQAIMQVSITTRKSYLFYHDIFQAINGLNGMQLGEKKLIVQRASVGAKQNINNVSS